MKGKKLTNEPALWILILLALGFFTVSVLASFSHPDSKFTEIFEPWKVLSAMFAMVGLYTINFRADQTAHQIQMAYEKTSNDANNDYDKAMYEVYQLELKKIDTIYDQAFSRESILAATNLFTSTTPKVRQLVEQINSVKQIKDKFKTEAYKDAASVFQNQVGSTILHNLTKSHSDRNLIHQQLLGKTTFSIGGTLETTTTHHAANVFTILAYATNVDLDGNLEVDSFKFDEQLENKIFDQLNHQMKWHFKEYCATWNSKIS